MMSFLLFNPKPKSILLLGIGGGCLIHFLLHWFPKLAITAVDINNKMITLAKKYFKLSKTPQLNIQTDDALNYLSQTKQKDFDVILIDLHNGKSLPDFLYHADFMQQCFYKLSTEGILVVNILAKQDNDLLKIMIALRQSFKGTSFCITLKKQQNILLFAFKSKKELELNQLKTKACQQQYHIEFNEFIKNIIIIEPSTKG